MWKASARIYSQSRIPLRNGNAVAHRNASGNPNRSNSNFLTVAAASVLGVVGGSVVLAKVSDGYRKMSESYIPGSAFLYNLILGPQQQPIKIENKFELKPKPSDDSLMKKKLEREATKKKDAPLIISSAGDSTLEPPKFSTDFLPAEAVETSKVVINEEPTSSVGTENVTQVEENNATPSIEAPSTITSPPEDVQDVPSVDLAGIDPDKFSTLLSDLHSRAVKAVNEAVEAQDTAAATIKKHVEMVFKSLEKIYEPGQTPENVWEPVFQATQDKSEAVKKAETKAHEARMAVGQLKETVAYCLKNDQSKQSPDLITMDENVARALYSLETAKARVEAAQSEAKVMDEYRELVDTARRNLQLELSSIRPELTPTFKTEDTKLGEEELNILMAHAYWKIITLQKELAKQQHQEQQRLRGALQTQRKEDSSILESRLRVELERQYYELKAQYNHDISVHEQILSDQFTQQLKRQAGAYTDHLNETLNMQKEELIRRFEGERELELAKVLASYHGELAKLFGMAKGVQEAVHNRAEKDRIARQVRELWVSAQLLIDTLRSNEVVHLPWEDQRRPLEQSLNVLTQVVNKDEFTQAVMESIPPVAATSGVLPQGAIKERFLNVERVCRRVALIDQNGGSLIRYALSYLQSLMIIKVDARPPSKEDEEIDPSKLNTFDILARTRYHLEKDDLEQALRYMNLLSGEPQLVAKDWLQDLRLHLEAVQAAQAILTYATVQAIESM